MEETKRRVSYSSRQRSTLGGLLITGSLVLLGPPAWAAKPGAPPAPPPPPPFPTETRLPPNVMFLLDNNESMQDFPRGQELPEDFTPGWYPAPHTNPGRRGYVGGPHGDFVNTGCSDPALVAAMSWFDKDSQDPTRNGQHPYDSDTALASPFFEKDQFYQARGRRIAWQMEDYPFSLSSTFGALQTWGDAFHACYVNVGYDYNNYYFTSTGGSPELMDECQTCLATKGWWRGPRITATTSDAYNDSDFPPKTHVTGEPPPDPRSAYRKWVVSGGVLNLRPPQFVVARKVLKDVITAAPNVRMGVATFGPDHGWFDPALVLEGLRPSCSRSSPTLDETELNRALLRSAVNQVNFSNNERSAGEALFALGGYFSSQRQDARWAQWFTNDFDPAPYWPGRGSMTINNPDTGQVGYGYASRFPDEWLKPMEWTGTAARAGQPFEESLDNARLPYRSVCQAEQANAVILITNGAPRYDNSVPITRMMSLLVDNGARHPDGSLVYFDPSNPLTNTNPGGINYCDAFLTTDLVTGQPRQGTQADCDYTAYNWPHGMAQGNKNFMDDVSFFLSHMDLRDDLPGHQSVRTSIVGYGTQHLMLQSMALAGQGQFHSVTSERQLRNAVLDILGGLQPSDPTR